MFLKGVEKGNNQPLMMVLMIIVVAFVLFISQGGAGVVLGILAGPEIFQNMEDFEAMNFAKYGVSNNVVYFILLFSFVLPFFSLFFVKAFHQRPFKSLLTSASKFRWNRVLTGIVIWFVILFAATYADYLMDKENYELTFNLSAFIPMLIISFILFPFQIGFEEIFFRGYLYQVIGYVSKRPWIAWVITSLAFALMHSTNPEVKEYGFWTMFPSYILLGMFLGLITILDNGLELALGVHFINNMFLAVGVNYSGAVLKTDAIFSLKTMDPTGGWIGILLSASVFMAVLWKKSGWTAEIKRVFIKYQYPLQDEIIQTEGLEEAQD